MDKTMRRDRVQSMVVREDKILLVKHNMNGREFYCLPGGGIENGETPEEAAIRELKEESMVDGKIIRKLSVQFKPENRGEVHTYLVEIDENDVPEPGTDPEFSAEEQTITGVAWLSLEQLGEVDKAYLWAAGLNRIDFFHKKLLAMENKIFK